jgi:Protein of unknown function (DUF1566)
MKSSRKFAVAMALATGLGFVSASAHAQTVGNGPYYATPSWDQTLPANTRFIVLSNFNNEAVLDRETGLVWQRTPSNTETTWGIAVNVECRFSAATGGRMGWRLPSLVELQSLVDPKQSNPSLPAGHPFLGVKTVGDYWSSTTSTVILGGTLNAAVQGVQTSNAGGSIAPPTMLAALQLGSKHHGYR